MSVLLQRGKKFYHISLSGNHFYRLVESPRSCWIFSLFIYILNVFWIIDRRLWYVCCINLWWEKLFLSFLLLPLKTISIIYFIRKLNRNIQNFMFEFPCIISLQYIKNQQDATLAVLSISNCKITLHVSDASSVHHQEY